MPVTYKQDKDTIIFVTKEDHSTPSSVTLPEEEPPLGLIRPDGSINWSCPCLGGMATGPCGVEFREAFSCFHYSEAEPKGSDCYEAFKTMQECMAQYPTLYNKEETNGDDLGSGMDENMLTDKKEPVRAESAEPTDDAKARCSVADVEPTDKEQSSLPS